MKKELSFITVIGKDKKGIVAKISNLLYKNNVNIEDINQKIMEGLFVMTMLVDISGYKYPINEVPRAKACGFLERNTERPRSIRPPQKQWRTVLRPRMYKLNLSLEKIGKEMGLRIQLQHENIFKMMHRV